MDIPFLKNKKSKLKVLFVAAEAAPFVKVGGLGEVMYALPKSLRELGHDARVMLPKYGTIDIAQYNLKREIEGIRVESGDIDPYGLLACNVLRYEGEGGDTIAYFLENQEYYEKRANVYGYSDDTARWVLLSKGALEFVMRAEWKPDIIVASDWQTGFIPNLLHTEYKDDPILSRLTVIFSIHNLRFQGLFDPKFVSEMDFDSGQKQIPNFFDPSIAKMNGMRRGIMYADTINTVSPTYAREILTEDFGEQLHELLDERKSRLFGILNGIDYDSFNPETDSEITTRFSVKALEKRIENKIPLQRQFGLPEDNEKFVIAMVSRLDRQKGLDLVMQVAGTLLTNIDVQLVVLGDGANEYREFFRDLQKKYPQRVGGHYFFDEHLPRTIFAGADAVLIPSLFEASGLVQMEAMRYGCVPIVRKIGGLADSVEDFRPGSNRGNGFVFENFDAYSLLIAIIRAHDAYGYKAEWRKLVKRAMLKDFSWKKSADDYIRLFQKAIKSHQADLKK